MGIVRTFEDLECWKKGTRLRREIAITIKQYPDYEKYGIVSQMRRSSRSITHNISEGYGRYHYKENVQFCRTARGSIYELLDQIIVSKDEGYIDLKRYEELRLMITDCTKVLNGYINYLIKAKDK
ncbi:four helix bundle protein [Costertonia aggregata]|uniref:Four helix bundle protein n=1 Tax=Costertonia aggregata TaxID=343403 RepID=A0A7H9APH6_9FLAO|nr:four helix bundle protein [Costertonia aggregata]QLG45332.1 four helix bundle protein [Costertonia aggregata]